MNQDDELQGIKDSIMPFCKEMEAEVLIRKISRDHPMNFKNIYGEIGTKLDDKVSSNPRLKKKCILDILFNWLQTSEKEYYCPNCNCRIKSRQQFKEHVQKVHIGIIKLKKKPVKKRCLFCDGSFRYLKIHISRQHTKEKPYRCQFCVAEFYDPNGLEHHVTLRHRKLTSYPCPICNKRDIFTHAARLQHIRYNHKNQRTYDCPHCSRKHNANFQLQRHIKLKHEVWMDGNVRFGCKLCDNVYDHPHKLKRHEYQHSRTVQELICGICSKVFKTGFTLNQHVRVHTTESPFKCELCEKTFKRQSNLFQHSKIHSQLRAFHCQSCNVSFKFGHHLKNHMKTLAHSDSIKLRQSNESDLLRTVGLES